MAESILSEVKKNTSLPYEIGAEYPNVQAKNSNNCHVYIIYGPSTRENRRQFIKNFIENIEVKGYKFFYIDGKKTLTYRISEEKFKISSEIGFVFGISDNQYQKISSLSLDNDIWTKSRPDYIITVKPLKNSKAFKLKPSDINNLVGNKVSADKLKKLVIDYVPEEIKGLFDSYFKDLQKSSVSEQVTMIEFGSEAIEIFSAYSLIYELKRKTKLREKIGIDSKNGDLKLEILFPSSQNTQLFDYYVCFLQDRKEKMIKVSVKNATRGVNPNTVTPKNLFKDPRELYEWFKNNKEQKLEHTTFWGGTVLPSPAGKTSNLYPLESAKKFKKDKIVSLVYEYLNTKKIKLKGNQLKGEIGYIYDYLKKNNVRNLKQKDTFSDERISSFLENTILSFNKGQPNVTALSFLFEKVFEYASRKNGDMNFVKMFSDKVIYEKQIIYSTLKTTKNNKLYFETIGRYNWETFIKRKNWMSLRSKNSADSLGYGALGIDPRLF